MDWARKRLYLSAFLSFHLAAMTSWSLPDLGVPSPYARWADGYLSPLGLWHGWTMFAPNPPRETSALEADVTDARGVRRHYDFPRMAGRPPWRAIWGFRYSKYVHSTLIWDGPGYREVAARHAVRSVNVPADAFPVEVRLAHRIRKIPPPDGPAPEAEVVPVGRYRFRSASEVGR